MALTDQQLQDAVIEILKIIGVSRLPSKLQNIPGPPGKQHFLHIQSGEADGQRINVEQLRGYFGQYNPTTNSPSLSNNTGVEGTYYVVTSSGSRDFGNGVVNLKVDDILEFRGGRWKTPLNLQILTSQPQTIDLGEIGAAEIDTAFNTHHDQNPVTVQPVTEGLVMVSALRNGEVARWLFVGSSGVYDEVNTATPEDFFSGGGVADIALVDNLTSTSVLDALTANQGRVLKGFIDNINTLLNSDDVTLDELQEIVNFIKQNKETLDTLELSNIAGLVDALASKSDVGHLHDERYLRTEVDPTGIKTISVSGTTTKTITVTRNNDTTTTATFTDLNDGTGTTTTYEIITAAALAAGTDLTERLVNAKVLTDWLNDALSDKADTVAGKQLSTEDYTTPEKTKLGGIEAGATADQTGAEIIAAIDTQLGSTEWKTQRTLEQIQDIVGAMFQSGNHTNANVTYDDATGTISISASGSGAGMTEEEVEDIVGGFAIPGNGINITYDDVNNTLTFTLSGEVFTTAEKNKLAAIEVGATADQTGAEIVSSINSQLGSIEWQTQKTLEQIQDIVGAMFQSGNHTNANVVYDDATGTISISASGTGDTMTEEEIEDIVGGFAIPGNGINITYDDTNNTLTFTLAGEIFTTTEKNKVANVPADTNAALAGKSDTGHSHTFGSLTGKPTTLSGYGITDAEKKRTIKNVPNTTQYTLVTADFTDFILDFTANAGETISVILNSGVAPAVGQIQMISSGNHILEVVAGTGVAITKPENTTYKSVGKGSWLGIVKMDASNTFALNGSLESTETAGETYTVFSATENGLVPTPNEVGNTKFLRQDGTWVVPEGGTGGGTYNVFTNTEDGLVPAPNVSGSTSYGITIDSPTEGQEFTEGATITVTGNVTGTAGTTYGITIDSPTEGQEFTEGDTMTVTGTVTETVTETVASPNRKILKSDGWEDERTEKRIVSYGDDVEYTLQLEDKLKFLNLRTLDDTVGYINITIPSGVFANGDVIKGYDHFGFRKVRITSELNYIRTSTGAWSGTKEFILDGYFELRFTSTSSSSTNALGAVLSGDILEDDTATNMVGQSLTGTVIDLSNVVGNNYNYGSFSAATTYTFVNPVINGFARCFINAATEPTVTGATKVGLNAFVPNTPMEMVLNSPNGVAVEYEFIVRQ